MKENPNIEKIAATLRQVFQDLLKDAVKTKTDREALAKILGRSDSHIKHMIYVGEGGLDMWAKAFAAVYNLDVSAIANLRNELRKNKPLRESDRLWFALRDELGASEDELNLIVRCAAASLRIKKEIDELKKAQPKPRGPKPK